MSKKTDVHLRLAPAQVRPFSMDGATVEDLAKLGVQVTPKYVSDMRRCFSMDAAPMPITAASAGVPLQFLQTLLSGTVFAVTGARKIDDLVGRSVVGNWHDEEVVRTMVELTGQPRPYGDHGRAPLANFNTAFEPRTVVRFAMSMEDRTLEQERAAALRQNSAELKRSAIGEALAIEHNAVGFFGYNDGENRTYGFLNDPNLPAYQTLPVGASGQTGWSSKTFEEITGDLRLAASTLRLRTRERVEPEKTPCTLAMASDSRDFLNVTNANGITVKQWLKENYPNWTVESAPELNRANGGVNVFYLYADELPGPNASGVQKVVEQNVPAVFRFLGAEALANGRYEEFSSATAGVMWQIPVAVVRFTGN